MEKLVDVPERAHLREASKLAREESERLWELEKAEKALEVGEANNVMGMTIIERKCLHAPSALGCDLIALNGTMALNGTVGSVGSVSSQPQQTGSSAFKDRKKRQTWTHNLATTTSTSTSFKDRKEREPR